MGTDAPSRRGPPRKPRPPPGRGREAAVVEPVFNADDLANLAAEAGIALTISRVGLVVLAEAANAALDHAAQMAALAPPAVPAARRDWCASIATMARDLAEGLGVRDDEANADGGLAPWAAHGNLEPGIHHLAETTELRDLLAIAVPGSPGTVDDAALLMLGRLTPALLALAAIAEAARDKTAAQARRGGSARDDVRRLLVERVGVIYLAMSGRPIGVSTVFTPRAPHGRNHVPGGPAVRFFAALFRHVVDALGPAGAMDAGRAAVLEIAACAVSGEHRDTIAGWLRDNGGQSAITDFENL